MYEVHVKFVTPMGLGCFGHSLDLFVQFIFGDSVYFDGVNVAARPAAAGSDCSYCEELHLQDTCCCLRPICGQYSLTGLLVDNIV